MSDVLRWDIDMVKNPIGRFVSNHDYAVLREENTALRARLAHETKEADEASALAMKLSDELTEAKARFAAAESESLKHALAVGQVCIELNEEKRAREAAESRLREYEEAPLFAMYCDESGERELIIRPRGGKGE